MTQPPPGLRTGYPVDGRRLWNVCLERPNGAVRVWSVVAVDREPLVDIDNAVVIEVVQQDLLITHALLIRVFVPDAELYGHASRGCRSLRRGDVAGSGSGRRGGGCGGGGQGDYGCRHDRDAGDGEDADSSFQHSVLP